MNKNPLVSIIIPAYNASNYLAEAIDSALAQTYSNIEIIVVNDGSEDNCKTREVAKSYGEKIRYIEKENGGSSSALNTGIKNMRGEWFSWLSHDDLYAPNKVQEQVDYINSLESKKVENNVLFSASVLIDANGKVLYPFNEKQAKFIANVVNNLNGNNALLVAELTKYTFHGCSCFVHRDVFKEIGMFDESLRLLNDVELWYRIYTYGYNVHYIPKPLVYGRVHSKQVSRSIGFSCNNSEQDMLWNRRYDWLVENYPNDEELFFYYGRGAFKKNRFSDGKKAFDYLKKLNPKLSMKLRVLKIWYWISVKVYTFAKNMYLRVKV